MHFQFVALFAIHTESIKKNNNFHYTSGRIRITLYYCVIKKSSVKSSVTCQYASGWGHKKCGFTLDSAYDLNIVNDWFLRKYLCYVI